VSENTKNERLTEAQIAALEQLAPAASPWAHDAIVALAAEVRRLNKRDAERDTKALRLLADAGDPLARRLVDAPIDDEPDPALPGARDHQDLPSAIERLTAERDAFQMATEEGSEIAACMRTELDVARARDAEWQRVTACSEPAQFPMAVCGAVR
jgi:hypothetical protein